jgi:hypothetical protein
MAIENNFCVIPADAVVIQANGVTFFPANGQWHTKIAVNRSLVNTFQHMHGDGMHARIPQVGDDQELVLF